MDMIRAGIGNILGKYSCLNDWRLANTILDEPLCPWVYDLVMAEVQNCAGNITGCMARDPHAIGDLMNSLVMIGVAMAYVGNSRPASGSEHHLSHYFEITGIIHNRSYLDHGIDVAYSTVITAALREKILNTPWPDTQYRLDRDAYVAEMTRIYGPVAEGCIALQDKVGLYNKDMLSVYKAKEAKIRQVLSQMPTAEEIQGMLEAVGLDMGEFYKLYSQEKLADAVSYAKELKDRYSVLWMYYDMFGGEKYGCCKD
jgi:glycerol-1-phosphate dehydrogenase [NAD(P)+]